MRIHKWPFRKLYVQMDCQSRKGRYTPQVLECFTTGRGLAFSTQLKNCSTEMFAPRFSVGRFVLVVSGQELTPEKPFPIQACLGRQHQELHYITTKLQS